VGEGAADRNCWFKEHCPLTMVGKFTKGGGKLRLVMYSFAKGGGFVLNKGGIKCEIKAGREWGGGGASKNPSNTAPTQGSLGGTGLTTYKLKYYTDLPRWSDKKHHVVQTVKKKKNIPKTKEGSPVLRRNGEYKDGTVAAVKRRTVNRIFGIGLRCGKESRKGMQLQDTAKGANPLGRMAGVLNRFP